MTDLTPTLTPSQQAIVDRIADAVALGDRICIRGESGAGRGTILRAAAGRVAATSGRSVAVLDAQSSDRLSWGILRRSSGQFVRPSELTEAGVVLFIDNGNCHVRIREQDPIIIAGDYVADTVIDIPAWTEDDIAAVAPALVEEFRDATTAMRTPRHITIAEAYLRSGDRQQLALSKCRREFLVARLIERVEAESPLSIDLLFAASELGTLPIATGWFAGWRDVTTEQAASAAIRLHQMALIDPHSAGEWTTPAIVRNFVRQQVSVSFRRAAARGLAQRLLKLAESQPLDVLPHLTTLWKKLKDSQPEIAQRIWEFIAPQWESYGFGFRDVEGTPADPSTSITRALLEAKQMRQRGAILEAEQALAKAVRAANEALPADNPSHCEARLEYAEVSLTGPRRPDAITELRQLLKSDWAATNSRIRRRIEVHLASALFHDGRFAEAATAFETLAMGLGSGIASARAWSNAGECLRSLGELPRAEAALRNAIAQFDSVGVRDEPGRVASELNLGHVLSESGRDGDAIRFYESAAEKQDRLYGPDAAGTLSAKVHLAKALARLNRAGEATQIFKTRPGQLIDTTLEIEFEVLGAILDRHAGRTTKAELALLRLAPREDLPVTSRTEVTHLLADGFLHEARVEEATRWSRIAVEGAAALGKRWPAESVRVHLTASRIEMFAERWNSVSRLANAGLELAGPYAVPLASEVSSLQALLTLAADPELTTWHHSVDAFHTTANWTTQNCLAATPVNRLAEHALEHNNTEDLFDILTVLIAKHRAVPRQWKVLHASIAVLNGDGSAATLWNDLAEQSVSRDPEEQKLAETIARELSSETAGSSTEMATRVRDELNRALHPNDVEQDQPENFAAFDPDEEDLDDTIEEAGHVLDELF